jgi:hypothetical protein
LPVMRRAATLLDEKPGNMLLRASIRIDGVKVDLGALGGRTARSIGGIVMVTAASSHRWQSSSARLRTQGDGW